MRAADESSYDETPEVMEAHPTAPRAPDVERWRLKPSELYRAHWSFMARHLEPARASGLLRGPGIRPRIGDLALVRVVEIGRHRRIETREGRRAPLTPGDLLVVAYGARYAPDQFRGVLPRELAPCHLLAAGGLVGHCVQRHGALRAPTRVAPLGLLTDAHGRVWNTRALAPLATATPACPPTRRPFTVVIAGTAMNAGKTTTLCALVRGWKLLGYRIAAVKASGTASAGDRCAYLDAGADCAFDPGDAGLPSTADVPFDDQWAALQGLLAEARRRRVDRLAVEIADGFLCEDSARLAMDLFREGLADALLVTAADAAGALAAASWAERTGLPLVALSGAFTQAPLAVEECRSHLSVPVIPPARLADAAWLPDDA